MAEKFKDLVEAVCGDHIIDVTDGYEAAHDIFGWLDDNPGLVPTRGLDPSEQDRIDAWHQVAKHPALEVCYRRVGNDTSFLDAVMERLTELEEATREGIELLESELDGEIDREHALSGAKRAGLRRFALSLGVTTKADPEPEWPEAPGAVVKTTGKLSELEHLLVLGADGKWRSVGTNPCVDPTTHPSKSHVLQEVVASA